MNEVFVYDSPSSHASRRESFSPGERDSRLPLVLDEGELRRAQPARRGGVTISSPERLYLSLIVNHGIAPAAQQQEAVDRFVREVERLWTGVTAPRTSRTPARASNPAGAVR